MRRREKTTDEARQQKTLRRDFERCFAHSGQPIENNIFPRAALRGDRRSALPWADLLQPLRGKGGAPRLSPLRSAPGLICCSPFGGKKTDAIPSKPRSAADLLRGPLGTRVLCHGPPRTSSTAHRRHPQLMRATAGQKRPRKKTKILHACRKLTMGLGFDGSLFCVSDSSGIW